MVYRDGDVDPLRDKNGHAWYSWEPAPAPWPVYLCASCDGQLSYDQEFICVYRAAERSREYLCEPCWRATVHGYLAYCSATVVAYQLPLP